MNVYALNGFTPGDLNEIYKIFINVLWIYFEDKTL